MQQGTPAAGNCSQHICVLAGLNRGDCIAVDPLWLFLLLQRQQLLVVLLHLRAVLLQQGSSLRLQLLIWQRR